MIMMITNAGGCLLAPPYFYISFHNTIQIYTKNGCSLNITNDYYNHFIQQPRGMLIRQRDLSLLITDASLNYITAFSNCHNNKLRTFLLNYNYSFNHPYGITQFQDSLWITNQNSNNVVLLNAQTLEPIKEFISFKNHNNKNNNNGVRGVAADNDGNLWVASKHDNTLYKLNGITGEILQKIHVSKIIGVYYCNTTNLLFVSGYKKVVSIKVESGQIVHRYHLPKHETHPTGMVTYNGELLYVLGQKTNSLYSYSINNHDNSYIYKIIIRKFQYKRPEHIILSECL